MDWKEKVEKLAKGSSTFGIIAAILMIVAGVVTLINPAGSLNAILWLIIIALVVAGIFRIVAYARMPYWIRQGFSLATGIIDIICGILLCVSMVGNPFTDDMFALFIGLMFAFEILFSGINTLGSVGVAKRMGGSTGWLVASGILAIIAAILLLAVPAAGAVFLVYALGFALIVGGISLFATSVDLRNRSKAFGKYIDEKGASFDPDSDPFLRWKMN